MSLAPPGQLRPFLVDFSVHVLYMNHNDRSNDNKVLIVIIIIIIRVDAKGVG